jgi:multidrug efflux pump subunit AcrB
MMWIVKIALRAPYTFTVLAIVLLIGGALSALQMPKDIFPAINIPVVGIIWTYNGLPAGGNGRTHHNCLRAGINHYSQQH